MYYSNCVAAHVKTNELGNPETIRHPEYYGTLLLGSYFSFVSSLIDCNLLAIALILV